MPKRKAGSYPKRAPVKRVKRRKNVKAARKRNRRMRRTIKNVVDKVLECKENVGVYVKYYTGEIEPVCTAGRDKIAWAMTRAQGNAAQYNLFSMAFTPFIAKRVLDAASTLYNAKAKNINIDAPGNFPLGGLKVDVLYCSYQMELVNYTTSPYEIEIIEVENKSASQTNFLGNAEELNNANTWIGGAPYFTTAAGNQHDIERTLDFGMIKGLASKYAVKGHGKKIVAPGGKISYFAKDKKCVDFKKIQYTESAGAAELTSYAKGERQLMIRYSPVGALSTNGTNYVYNHASGTNDANHGFVVSVKEVWKIMEPDNTSDTSQGDVRVNFNDEGTLEGSTQRWCNLGGKLSDYVINV